MILELPTLCSLYVLHTSRLVPRTDFLQQRKLYSFLIDLERLDLEELLSMHAVTTTMEYLALLLVFFLDR